MSVVITPPTAPPIYDDVQRTLVKFAELSARASGQSEPDLATLIDQAGLRAAASQLRRDAPVIRCDDGALRMPPTATC